MPDRHAQKRAAMAANLEAQTGRSLEDWVDLVTAEGPDGFMATVGWLKDNYGIGHFQARLIAEVRRDLS